MGQVIPEGSRILLETVALIYFLEGDPRYEHKAMDVFGRIESGALRGVLATLAFAELLVPLYRAGNADAANGLRNRLCNFRNIEVVALTAEIGAVAAKLRADHNLRTPDAIHGATALVSGAAGILTNDKRLAVLAKEGLSVWLFDALE